MIIKKIFGYLLIMTFLVIIYPLFSFGQTNSPLAGLIEMTISPENPEPLQMVNATLQSFSYDLDRSKITWLVDGVEKKTDIGLKQFSTLAGKNGQKTTIKARVQTADGSKEAEISFIPSVVDLIYESRSYTPPFYKGRALNPKQGLVVVTAIPELLKSTGEKILVQNIIYSWKRNGEAQQSASGIAKNTFTFSGSVPVRDNSIEVTVSSLVGNITASKQINISNVEPKIVFYEDSPVYGIMFNKAIINTVKLTSDEFKVKTSPYFMSVGYTQSPDLNYKWMLNDKEIENLTEDKTAMVFRQENSGAGTASVGLTVENISKIFQQGKNSFLINFEKQ
jgi:hypothetical protein